MSEGSARVHRLREVLLNVGAMLGVMSILLAASAMAFGITPLVFRSGSMAPAIRTGDLGIAQTAPAADLRVGDIVTVSTSGGLRVTHRIVELDQTDSGALLVLQGDANEDPDPDPYAVAEAERLIFAIPRAGYVASWLSGPGGVFLGGLLVGLVLLVMLRRPSRRPPQGRRRADITTRTSVLLLGAALVALPSSAFLPQPVGTMAAWNDSVDVTGASFTGYTVPQPTLTCLAGTPSSTGNTQHMSYSWPGVTAPGTTYTVAVSGLGVAPTTTLSGTTTRTLDIAYDSSKGSNKGAVATVTVSPALTASSSWAGPQAITKFKTNDTAKKPGICGETDSPASILIAAPDAATRTIADEKHFITSTCTTSSVILCGTYVDASAVTIGYTLKRTQGTIVKCWTGSWSNPQAGGVCSTFQAGTTTTVDGMQVFSATAAQNTVFPTTGAGSYVLTVTLTDTFDNITTDSVSFILNP